jgi:lipopolysaccharide export system permease protein
VLLRFLSWFVVTLVVLAAGITIAEMLLHLDDMSESAEGVAGAVKFLALRVCSYYLPILIPIASFTATYLSLGMAARWLEITAAKAGGVSPIAISIPVLVAAAVLSGVTLLVNETVVLQADRAWRKHLSGQDAEIEFRRGSFWYATGRYIYNVGDADPEQEMLHDLKVFEMGPDGRLDRRIDASLAQVRDGDLHLFDATEMTFPREDPTAVPDRRWQREVILDTDSGSSPNLLQADAATLSLGGLREFIHQRAQAGGQVTRFIGLFHARLTDPLTVFLLALLAIPFALRVEQTKSLAIPALQGVAVLLVFWSLRSGTTLAATSGETAAALAPWLVLGLFLAGGTWRYLTVPR